MSVENLNDDQFSALKNTPGYAQACELIEAIEKSGFEAYLVGGCVRDMLLKRDLKDFDMCTSANPDEIKSVFKDYKLLLQGEAFGTVSVVVDKKSYEITSFRGDGVYSDSRHPDAVKFVASLKEDLLRRDFTINALAFHPQKGLINLVGGLEDLNLKILKTVGDPEKRFGEDALRIARLIRFAVQLGFAIDDQSLVAAKQLAPSLKKISKERVYTEFRKMLSGEPKFKVIDQIFKTSFVGVFGPSKELGLFEKAYAAIKICEALSVSVEDSILEKSLRQRCLHLQKMASSDNPQTDFVRLCDKFMLFEEKQLDVWSLVLSLEPKYTSLKMAPYSKSRLVEATHVLKTKHQGKDLGDAIFEFKKKALFN